MLCIGVCSQNLLKMSKSFNKSGYHYAEITADNCRGCKRCALICPEAAIELFLEENENEPNNREET